MHSLTVTPSLFWRYQRRRFLLLDTEAVVDWNRGGEARFKSGVLLGAVLRGRRAVWIKLEPPWGEHRRGEWILKSSIAWRKRD